MSGLEPLNWINYATTFIVAIAGMWWAVTKFFWHKEHYPRIQFDITAKVIDIHQKHAVVSILSSLHNKGNVPLSISRINMEVRGFRCDDAFGNCNTDAPNARIDFTHTIHNASTLPKGRTKISVFPGIIQQKNTAISVPLTMRYVYINAKFYNDNNNWEHSTSTVIKIESSIDRDKTLEIAGT